MPDKSAVISFAAVLLLLITSLFPSSSGERQTIIVLHSYHHGFTWTDDISRGIMSATGSRSGSVELRFEFMDTRRYHHQAYMRKFLGILQEKDTSRNVNAIICSDDHAFNFMLKAGGSLYADVPLLFCSVSGDYSDLMAGRSITGLKESIDIPGTLKLALDLHPSVKKIAVITDMTRTGTALKKKTEAALMSLEEGTGYYFLQDKNFDNLKSKVASLGDDTLIFLLIFSKDMKGRVFSHEENLKQLSAICEVPVYSVWDFYLGSGITGGRLCSGFKEGEMVGELALKVLDGTPAGDIPQAMSPLTYMFDYNYLQKFSIPESRLPVDSVVINKPVSMVSEHMTELITMIVVMITLSLLVMILTISIQAKNQAQAQLRNAHADLEQKVKEKTRELIRSEQLAAVGTLAGGVAHEFNNINTAIMGFAEMGLSSPIENNKVREYLQKILRSAERGGEITANLLAFAGKKEQRNTMNNLVDIFKDTLVLVENTFRTEGIKVVTDLAPLPDTEMDSAQIGQVILNILINASHAMLESPVRDIRVTSFHEGEYEGLSIADSGRGMSPQQLERIFDPFFSTKGEHAETGNSESSVKGTGLGLSISQTIVHNHNGELTVDSAPGRGSVFTLKLPIKKTPGLEINTGLKGGAPADLAMMVVDDEKDICELISEGLRRFGYRVEAHADPGRALDQIGEKELDVLLLDMQMPGIPGEDFLERLREIEASSRPRTVIIITGKRPDLDIAQYTDLNVRDIIYKPFGLEQLVNRIGRAVGK